MKQGRRDLGVFLAEFDRTVLEAEAIMWDDAAKISYLKRALNQDIRRLLITVEEPKSYTGFCTKLKELDRKREEYEPKKSWYRSPAPSVPASSWV